MAVAECADVAKGDCGLLWVPLRMDCCWVLWWEAGMCNGTILPAPILQSLPTLAVWAFDADTDSIPVGILCDCDAETNLCAYMDGNGCVVKVASCEGCDIVMPVMALLANIGLVEYMGWCARSICKMYAYFYTHENVHDMCNANISAGLIFMNMANKYTYTYMSLERKNINVNVNDIYMYIHTSICK